MTQRELGRTFEKNEEGEKEEERGSGERRDEVGKRKIKN